MTRHLVLNVNILNAGVFGGSWRFPGGNPLASYDVEHYTSIAQAAERAELDAVFLADGPVADPDLAQRSSNSFEPTTTLARIAGLTERIGLIATLSSTYNDARELARRVGDLDALSGGRVGWNVVTTAGPAAARNFGLDAEPEHSGRYHRAGEFVREVLRHWADGVAAPSPQGHPVIVQAGGSSDGARLASEVAEVVFSAGQSLEEGQRYRHVLRTGAVRNGRRADDIVVLPGLSTVVASTDAEARSRRDLLAELVPTDYALRRLSGQVGFDVAELELDAPFPAERLVDPDRAGGSQTFYREVAAHVHRERPTVRQLLRHLGGGAGHRIVVGTPERIADDIEAWFRRGGGDGFNLMPDVLPQGFHDFAEHVVPELRRRGLVQREYVSSTLRARLGLPPVVTVPRQLDVRAGERTGALAGGVA